MIGFPICRKCSKGNCISPKFSKEGDLKISFSVFCDIANNMLLVDSEIPAGCIYDLEQKMVQSELIDFKRI